MYKREIDILTTVFGDYFIYVGLNEKTANSKNIEFDYNYVGNLINRNILIIKFDYGIIKCYILNTELEKHLKKIYKNRLRYVTEPVLHIYREGKINEIIQK